MKYACVLLICLLVCGCATVVYKYAKTVDRLGFNYINYTGRFDLVIDGYFKNPALCGKAVTYALAIGRPQTPDLPQRISVLLLCEYDVYKPGDTLHVEALNETMPQNPIYIVEHKSFKHEDHQRLIGAEYPALWGKIN